MRVDWKLAIPLSLLFSQSSATTSVGECPGYIARNVVVSDYGVRANLSLAGKACNAYGDDIRDLVFTARYQAEYILNVQISDADEKIYQVPDSVLPRLSTEVDCSRAALEVVVVEEPFSFAIRRKTPLGEEATAESRETIFNTSGSQLIFESQYWRLRTSLPEDPYLYGLGEHTDPIRLPTKSYRRTLWNRDATAVPERSNLYGSHPVYFENRMDAGGSQSHGVALINSNGMEVHVDHTDQTGQYLEYNVIGGIIDLTFIAGPEPFDVSRQYSEISGKPAMFPYWGLGFHNCRYGYHNVFEVAEVVYNYSKAEIPLETMWIDIDYMERYKVFTVDPNNYPHDKMREMIAHLHNSQQHFVVMVDPAVAYQNYTAFNRGSEEGIFMRYQNGSIFQGIVWPGIVAFPDWFNENTQDYWTRQFAEFFDPDTGIDIDALWIDMNEPSNFCPWPCNDPEGYLKGPGQWINPPPPEPIPHNPRPLPGWPADFQPPKDQDSSSTDFKIVEPSSGEVTTASNGKTVTGPSIGLPGRDLLDPPYNIHNAEGSISNLTMFTNLIHANGMVTYDTHNMYGSMMGAASRKAMLARKPTLRPMIVTRSTFMGDGRHVAHWLGDNDATWEQYRQSIRHMLQFTAFFQMPMVGADICGFLSNTTETLCARWARLGAFYTFFRDHNVNRAQSQELYRWPLTTKAGQKGISLRYQLLDYIYSALHQQTIDGTPLLFPMWMLYPEDKQASTVDLQFFYGPALLVNPVTEENSTEVSIYLPHDQFYDLDTLMPIPGEENTVTLTDIDYTELPVFIRGGNIIPMRVSGANTTTTLRTLDFELIVAPSSPEHGKKACGYLYLDDGVSLEQKKTSEITFDYDGDILEMNGTFNYDVGEVSIVKATILDPNGDNSPKTVDLNWDLTGKKRIDLSKTETQEHAPLYSAKFHIHGDGSQIPLGQYWKQEL